MTTWLRARNGQRIAAGLTALLALIAVIGSGQLSLPTVLGGGLSPTPMTTFLPIGFIAAVLPALEERASTRERRAVRRLGGYDLALVGACWAAIVLATLALSLAHIGPSPLIVARNLALLSGLALAVGAWTSVPVGMASATAFTVITSSIAVTAAPANRARVLQAPLDDALSFAVTCLCVALGTLAMLIRAPHRLTLALR